MVGSKCLHRFSKLFRTPAAARSSSSPLEFTLTAGVQSDAAKHSTLKEGGLAEFSLKTEVEWLSKEDEEEE